MRVNRKIEGIDPVDPTITARYSIELLRDRTVEYQGYAVYSVWKIMSMIGGFLGLMQRLAMNFLKFFNGFNLDNSMQQRLYSTKKKKVRDCDQEILDHDHDKEIQGCREDKIRAELRQNLVSRETFVGSCCSNYLHKGWFCSCFTCWRTPTRSDKLMADAQSKLNKEMDVLEIVKLLRIVRL